MKNNKHLELTPSRLKPARAQLIWSFGSKNIGNGSRKNLIRLEIFLGYYKMSGGRL